MRVKRNNLFFMLFVIIFTVGQAVLGQKTTGWGLYSVIPYLICFGLGLLILKKDEATFFDVLPYNVGLKPLTALMIVALVFLMSPLTTLLSQLGAKAGGDMLQLFGAQLNLDNKPFPELLFELAVVPAVFEEMYFRGFFYAGFKRARGARFAIIFSAILFGFFHMNIQQLLYAAVLGIVLGIIREATGSMWAGMLYHFVNNGWSAVSMLIAKKTTPDHWLQNMPLEKISFFDSAEYPLTTGIRVYSWIMLVVCLAVSLLLLWAIAKQNGRADDYKKLFKRADDPKEKVVTAPLVIGCIMYALMTLIIFAAVKLQPELLQQAIEKAGK